MDYGKTQASSSVSSSVPISCVVSASDYCLFLNAEATTSDPNFLYNAQMSSDPLHACIARIRVNASADAHAHACEGYEYFVIERRENLPITFVNEEDQAAYCVWDKSRLHEELTLCNISLKSNVSSFQVETTSTPTLSFETLSTPTSNSNSCIEDVSRTLGVFFGVIFYSRLMIESGDEVAGKGKSIHEPQEVIAPVRSVTAREARIEELSNAADNAKVGVLYAQRVSDAAGAVLDIFDSARDFVNARILVKSYIKIDTAAASATIAAENIEKFFASLKGSSQAAMTGEELSDKEAYLFIAVDLGLTAIKKTTQQVRSVTAEVMDDPRYQGKIASKALAPLHTIDEALLEELLARKKTIAITSPVFSTLAAKKDALSKAAFHAEAASNYVNDLYQALEEVDDIFSFYRDFPSTEQLLAAKDWERLKTTQSIAKVAVKDLDERLSLLERVPEEDAGDELSMQKDAKLLIAAHLAVDAVKEAAEKISAIFTDFIVNEKDQSEEEAEAGVKALAALHSVKAAFAGADDVLK